MDKKDLVKKYYELLKMMEETKRNNLYQTLQQNKYLRVDKKHLAKKYFELLKMIEDTKRNNLYQARLTSQCSCESRCESFGRIQEFITTFFMCCECMLVAPQALVAQPAHFAREFTDLTEFF